MAQENDIVLIYFEDIPVVFARIEDISPDSKPDWYHVKLLMLQVPIQVVTWILRDVYISGDDFTMNDKKIRLEKVFCPESPEAPEQPDPKTKKNQFKKPEESKSAKIISLADLKK